MAIKARDKVESSDFKNQKIQILAGESPAELLEKARTLFKTKSVDKLWEVVLRPCKDIKKSPLYSLTGRWENSKLIVNYSLSPHRLNQEEIMSCIPIRVKWNVAFSLLDKDKIVPFIEMNLRGIDKADRKLRKIEFSQRKEELTDNQLMAIETLMKTMGVKFTRDKNNIFHIRQELCEKKMEEWVSIFLKSGLDSKKFDIEMRLTNEQYWISFSRSSGRGNHVYAVITGGESVANNYFQNLKSVFNFEMPTCFYYDWVYSKSKKEPKKYFEFE